MRTIIFLSLGLLVTTVVVSGVTTTASASSDPLINGTVSNVYNGGMVAIAGYGSHVRLNAVSEDLQSSISESKIRRSLSSLMKGKGITCKKVDIDNYGTVEARCWDGLGNEITRALVQQNIAKSN